jgi:sporulation protein YlmC with PRC-barrel domain
MDNRDETASLISAGKVQGTNVYNTNGDSLGEVYDVMIDKLSGKVAYAIMSFGGRRRALSPTAVEHAQIRYPPGRVRGRPYSPAT